MVVYVANIHTYICIATTTHLIPRWIYSKQNNIADILSELRIDMLLSKFVENVDVAKMSRTTKYMKYIGTVHKKSIKENSGRQILMLRFTQS